VDVTSGEIPLTVQFTDTSDPAGSVITSWFWTFGDGHTSRALDPVHTYETIGACTVSLTVMNAVTGDTEVKSGLITVAN
jgi:PKD repeat protein